MYWALMYWVLISVYSVLVHWALVYWALVYLVVLIHLAPENPVSVMLVFSRGQRLESNRLSCLHPLSHPTRFQRRESQKSHSLNR